MQPIKLKDLIHQYQNNLLTTNYGGVLYNITHNVVHDMRINTDQTITNTGQLTAINNTKIGDNRLTQIVLTYAKEHNLLPISFENLSNIVALLYLKDALNKTHMFPNGRIKPIVSNSKTKNSYFLLERWHFKFSQLIDNRLCGEFSNHNIKRLRINQKIDDRYILPITSVMHYNERKDADDTLTYIKKTHNIIKSNIEHKMEYDTLTRQPQKLHRLEFAYLIDYKKLPMPQIVFFNNYLPKTFEIMQYFNDNLEKNDFSLGYLLWALQSNMHMVVNVNHIGLDNFRHSFHKAYVDLLNKEPILNRDTKAKALLDDYFYPM